MRLQESSKGRTDSLGVPGPLLRNKWHIFRLIKQIAARAKCWEETKILKTLIKDYFYTSSVQGGQVVVSSSGYKEIGIWILPPQQGKHSLHKAHWSFLLCSKWLAWSHWTPFSGFCPLKHTIWGYSGCAETQQELQDPAMLCVQAVFYPRYQIKAPGWDELFSLIFSQSLQMQLQHSGLCRAWSDILAGAFFTIALDARGVSCRAESMSALCVQGNSTLCSHPGWRAGEIQPRGSTAIHLPLPMETVNSC